MCNFDFKDPLDRLSIQFVIYWMFNIISISINFVMVITIFTSRVPGAATMTIKGETIGS